jgi:pre-mRNA-splicing helicase BRR2
VAVSTKRKGLVEILTASTEFDLVPVRPGEESALRGLAQSVGVRIGDRQKVNEAHTKAKVLLYVSFMAYSLTGAYIMYVCRLNTYNDSPLPLLTD